MAVSGKALVLVGLVVGGGVLFLATKKAKAKGADAQPQSPGVATQSPGIAPPLSGIPTTDPTGGVIVVPDEGEPEDSPPPAVVVPQLPQLPIPLPQVTLPPLGTILAPGPTPTAVPPTTSPPPAPAPTPVQDAQATFPGAVLAVPPEIVQAGADILTQAGIPTVVPLPPQITPPPSPTAPVVVPEPAETPTLLHDDTAAVLDVMLEMEGTSKWKRIEEALKPWQKARNLVVDGKLGPKSTLLMAAETGLLPIVRFWPTGTIKEKALPKFQQDLLAISATAEEPRKSQLVAAAQREKGQGFGSKQGPITPLIAFDLPA